MKYKVGDKVRVRKDLEVGNWYGHNSFVDSMAKMKGKVVTIAATFGFNYYMKETKYCWTDEMLEPVEDIIEYKGKKYDVDYANDWGKYDLALYLKEHKEEILDEAEKRYLSAVIKPFRDRVESIVKKDVGGYFLKFYLKNEEIDFPYLKDKRMYKGMKLDKEYSLEQLGL